ncbi:VOC family protein [Brachybacterium paraconglomeratum]|uniref:VOC family protein n=1 Tax=Brachybacterium paraconglomeratum TaxID=173362 RepID=UPI003FD3E2C2
MPQPQNSPYIAFPGNGQEVLTHWQEQFGGELEMMTYDEIPDLSGFPFTPPRGAVAHATLTGGLFTVSGGDAIGGPGDELPPLGSDVYSFLIGLEDVESAKSLFARIAEGGGKVAMPFELAPWGDHYGQVVDRFGVMFALVVGGSSTQS